MQRVIDLPKEHEMSISLQRSLKAKSDASQKSGQVIHLQDPAEYQASLSVSSRSWIMAH